MKHRHRTAALTVAGLLFVAYSGSIHARGPADIINDPAEVGLKLPGTMARSIKEERVLTVPDGKPVWTVVEAAGRQLQDQFDTHKH
jgi:acetyl-CoA carboxylase carboxyltransferase component